MLDALYTIGMIACVIWLFVLLKPTYRWFIDFDSKPTTKLPIYGAFDKLEKEHDNLRLSYSEIRAENAILLKERDEVVAAHKDMCERLKALLP